jgi:hypothetical protein
MRQYNANTYNANCAMGTMRQSDVPACAIDFHVSNVLDDVVLKGRTGSGSVREKVQKTYVKYEGRLQPVGKAPPQKKPRTVQVGGLDDATLLSLCREAMWECSSSTNFRKSFPPQASAQMVAGGKVSGVDDGRMEMLRAVWSEMEPECERYAAALVARRFGAGRR